tara:strand:+ start:285 stop:1127 length:843 start_codon:yes stop_codon:yes gene_type:complete
MKGLKGLFLKKYNLALVTKTFSVDIPSYKTLFDSINRFNEDNLPIFVIIPYRDKKLLQDTIGTEGYTVLYDHDIHEFRQNLGGWEQQMIIKLKAHHHISTNNLLLLDSDAKFIKPFFEKDFIAHGDIPYTIVHENKQVAEYETALKGGDYNKTGYVKAVKAYRDIFGYKSDKIYDFGPNPHLWSTKVLRDFSSNYLDYNGIELEQFCLQIKQQYGVHFRETLTYGEYLMATKSIEIIPCGPLFKTYHWKEMVEFEKGTGLELEENIAKNYLGIIMQSKHT